MVFEPLLPSTSSSLRVTVHMCGHSYLKKRGGNLIARPGWRIYRYADGGGGVEWQGKIITPGPDELMVIPPNTEIRHVLHRPCWHHWLHIGLGQPYDAVSDRIFIQQVTPTLRQLLDDLFDPPTNPAPGHLRTTAFVTHLLTQLPTEIWPDMTTDLRVARVLAEIHERPGAKLDNETLANTAGMSRNAFIRLFTKEVGRSPRTYILDRRMDDACQMLAYGDRTIESIATACGFGDRGYMTRLFAKKLGIAPGRYRRERRLS